MFRLVDIPKTHDLDRGKKHDVQLRKKNRSEFLTKSHNQNDYIKKCLSFFLF